MTQFPTAPTEHVFAANPTGARDLNTGLSGTYPTLTGLVHITSGFLPSGPEWLHYVEYSPVGPASRRSVLLVPPFAEEMNHARRMLHRLARRLAAHGHRVIMADLSGTGDSSGRFEDATWSRWLADLLAVRAWAEQSVPVTALVALRFGALLASAHQQLKGIEKLVFWDPVLRGSDQIRQFLRLRVLAGQFRQQAGGPATMRELEARMESGEALQVAGYTLNPALAAGIVEQDLLDNLTAARCSISWLQMGATEEVALPAATQAAITALAASGVDISATHIPGPRFWATTETTLAPVLIDATERLLST